MKTKATTSDTLGQRLHSLRKGRDLSLQALAEVTGISRSNLNRYERDESKPTASYLKVLCVFYRVSADWLLFGLQKEDLHDEGWAQFDPELKSMIGKLVALMTDADPHMRSWAIVQFANAFGVKS